MAIPHGSTVVLQPVQNQRLEMTKEQEKKLHELANILREAERTVLSTVAHYMLGLQLSRGPGAKWSPEEEKVMAAMRDLATKRIQVSVEVSKMDVDAELAPIGPVEGDRNAN